jgi:hypothetical protein
MYIEGLICIEFSKIIRISSTLIIIYDLFILISEFGQVFDIKTLSKAIKVTFTHRKTELPEKPVKVFTAYFYDDTGKLAQWKAFINKTTDTDLTLKEACVTIAAYIENTELF